MKKVIALIIMLVLVGTGSVFAVDWLYTGIGGGLALSGGILLGLTFSYGVEMPDDLVPLILGGGCAISGVLFLIYGLSAPSSKHAQAIEENPVLRHVSLDFSSNSVTVGFRKRY